MHPAPKIKTVPLGQEEDVFEVMAPLTFLDTDEALELSGALGVSEVSPSSVELVGEAPPENSFSKLESEVGYLWPFMWMVANSTLRV